LSIHEVNIQQEIKRHWSEISSYVISVLRTTGISDVEAEELAILPGMEELSAMMYVNQFRREERYQVIVLDCAPTAESLRFVSMPEKMVLPETQRAFVYFSLHGLTVDGIIVNRLLPEEVTDVYFLEWRASQAKVLGEIEAYFAPVKVKRVPLFTHEMLGRE